ncbi:hypothetical protein SLEP1_g40988 [Rubroshorea leprosula]|uniref:Uncharacterized protein n=1 Tax=Rubroshorea leprosula TaxID=152421 RepID=A0AAV5L5M7_9ROSI|nr:hypothetical protein SLEP1_g40988 [Rubroshorea leprosula]
MEETSSRKEMSKPGAPAAILNYASFLQVGIKAILKCLGIKQTKCNKTLAQMAKLMTQLQLVAWNLQLMNMLQILQQTTDTDPPTDPQADPPFPQTTVCFLSPFLIIYYGQAC